MIQEPASSFGRSSRTCTPSTATHGGDDDTDHVHFHTVVTFDALDGNKTRVTMRAIFATVEERNQTVAEYGAIEGSKQTLDRLGEHLATMASGADR